MSTMMPEKDSLLERARVATSLGMTDLAASYLRRANEFVAGDSSAARSARAKKQLRDRLGRWIEMGGGVRWKVPVPGSIGSGEWKHGKVIAIDPDAPGSETGKITVEDVEGNVHEIDNKSLESVKARIKGENDTSDDPTDWSGPEIEVVEDVPDLLDPKTAFTGDQAAPGMYVLEVKSKFDGKKSVHDTTGRIKQITDVQPNDEKSLNVTFRDMQTGDVETKKVWNADLLFGADGYITVDGKHIGTGEIKAKAKDPVATIAKPKAPTTNPPGAYWSDNESSALFDYAGQAHERINRYLRTGDKNHLEDVEADVDRIEHLRSLMQLDEFEEDTVVYRGVKDWTGKFPGQFETGAYIVDKGFMSTTHNLLDIEDGEFYEPENEDSMLMEIHVPKGTKRIDVDRVLGYKGTPASESEYVLPDGTGIRITADKRNKGEARRVVATVIPQAEADQIITTLEDDDSIYDPEDFIGSWSDDDEEQLYDWGEDEEGEGVPEAPSAGPVADDGAPAEGGEGDTDEDEDDEESVDKLVIEWTDEENVEVGDAVSFFDEKTLDTLEGDVVAIIPGTGEKKPERMRVMMPSGVTKNIHIADVVDLQKKEGGDDDQEPAPEAVEPTPEAPEAEAPEVDTGPELEPDKKFEILPKEERGASGDGYHPSGPWGKYGASGVLIAAQGSDGEDRFLLVQRGKGVSSNQGKWQLPGGAMDENENPYQGAARETQEELGATSKYVAGLEPTGETIFDNGEGWQYTNIAARADSMFDPDVDGTETGDAKWFTRDEIEDLRKDGKLQPSMADSINDVLAHFGTPESSQETISVDDEADDLAMLEDEDELLDEDDLDADLEEPDEDEGPDVELYPDVGTEDLVDEYGEIWDPVDTSGWTKTGGATGSNKGGFYTDQDGKQWYVKEPATDQHAKNEVAAAALYRLTGTNVPKVRMATVNGKAGIASPIQEGKRDLGAKIGSDPDYVKKIQEGYAVDAWLSNWDVAGTGHDNIITTGDGDPFRVDVGGSLLFRAQGSPKGEAFSEKPGELKTLRDPSMSVWAAPIFQDIDVATAKSSAQRVADVDPEDVDYLIDQLDFSDANSNELKAKLRARRQSIMNEFGVSPQWGDEDVVDTDVEPEAPEAPVIPEAPEAPEKVGPKRITDSEFIPLTSANDVKPGDRVWERGNGDGQTWAAFPGTVVDVTEYDAETDEPPKVVVKLDAGGHSYADYWHVSKTAAGDVPPPAPDAEPTPEPDVTPEVPEAPEEPIAPEIDDLPDDAPLPQPVTSTSPILTDDDGQPYLVGANDEKLKVGSIVRSTKAGKEFEGEVVELQDSGYVVVQGEHNGKTKKLPRKSTTMALVNAPDEVEPTGPELELPGEEPEDITPTTEPETPDLELPDLDADPDVDPSFSAQKADIDRKVADFKETQWVKPAGPFSLAPGTKVILFRRLGNGVARYDAATYIASGGSSTLFRTPDGKDVYAGLPSVSFIDADAAPDLQSADAPSINYNRYYSDLADVPGLDLDLPEPEPITGDWKKKLPDAIPDIGDKVRVKPWNGTNPHDGFDGVVSHVFSDYEKKVRVTDVEGNAREIPVARISHVDAGTKADVATPDEIASYEAQVQETVDDFKSTQWAETKWKGNVEEGTKVLIVDENIAHGDALVPATLTSKTKYASRYTMPDGQTFEGAPKHIKYVDADAVDDPALDDQPEIDYAPFTAAVDEPDVETPGLQPTTAFFKPSNIFNEQEWQDASAVFEMISELEEELGQDLSDIIPNKSELNNLSLGWLDDEGFWVDAPAPLQDKIKFTFGQISDQTGLSPGAVLREFFDGDMGYQHTHGFFPENYGEDTTPVDTPSAPAQEPAGVPFGSIQLPTNMPDIDALANGTDDAAQPTFKTKHAWSSQPGTKTVRVGEKVPYSVGSESRTGTLHAIATESQIGGWGVWLGIQPDDGSNFFWEKVAPLRFGDSFIDPSSDGPDFSIVNPHGVPEPDGLEGGFVPAFRRKTEDYKPNDPVVFSEDNATKNGTVLAIHAPYGEIGTKFYVRDADGNEKWISEKDVLGKDEGDIPQPTPEPEPTPPTPAPAVAPTPTGPSTKSVNGKDIYEGSEVRFKKKGAGLVNGTVTKVQGGNSPWMQIMHNGQPYNVHKDNVTDVISTPATPEPDEVDTGTDPNPYSLTPPSWVFGTFVPSADVGGKTYEIGNVVELEDEGPYSSGTIRGIVMTDAGTPIFAIDPGTGEGEYWVLSDYFVDEYSSPILPGQEHNPNDLEQPVGVTGEFVPSVAKGDETFELGDKASYETHMGNTGSGKISAIIKTNAGDHYVAIGARGESNDKWVSLAELKPKSAVDANPNNVTPPPWAPQNFVASIDVGDEKYELYDVVAFDHPSSGDLDSGEIVGIVELSSGDPLFAVESSETGEILWIQHGVIVPQGPGEPDDPFENANPNNVYQPEYVVGDFVDSVTIQGKKLNLNQKIAYVSEDGSTNAGEAAALVRDPSTGKTWVAVKDKPWDQAVSWIVSADVLPNSLPDADEPDAPEAIPEPEATPEPETPAVDPKFEILNHPHVGDVYNNPVFVGSEVRSTTDGFTGTVVALEPSGAYVKVSGYHKGKYKTLSRSRKKLLVVEGGKKAEPGVKAVHVGPNPKWYTPGSPGHTPPPPAAPTPEPTPAPAPTPTGPSVKSANGKDIFEGSKILFKKKGYGIVEGDVTAVAPGDSDWVKVSWSGGSSNVHKDNVTDVIGGPSTPSVVVTPTPNTPDPDATPEEIAKWKGKPQPPVPDATQAADDAKYISPELLDKMREHYKNKTGKNIEQSHHWNGRLAKIINDGSVADLDYLAAKGGDEKDKYFPAELYQLAMQDIQQRASIVQAAGAQHQLEMEQWHHDIISWQKANGLHSGFEADGFVPKGLVGARDWSSNSQGQTWAKSWSWMKNKFVQMNISTSELTSYTGSGSGPINSALYSIGKPSKISVNNVTNSGLRDRIKSIDKAMIAAPHAPEDYIVHRGVNHTVFKMLDGSKASGSSDLGDIVGTIQPNYGFSSTSVGTEAAFSSRPVQMKIRVPKEYKGVYVGSGMGISSHSTEREVVLDRGARYYIHSAKKIGGKWFIEAEIVPDNWYPELDYSPVPPHALIPPSTDIPTDVGPGGFSGTTGEGAGGGGPPV